MSFPLFLKATINNILRNIGYEIRKYEKRKYIKQRYEKQTESGTELFYGNYELVQPSATYSPWNENETFLRIYNKIHAYTLVDIYRCYELWSLIDQIEQIDGCLLEIGVWRGGTGALIACKAQLSAISAPIYLCDTFSGVVKASEKDSYYKGGEHSDTSRQTVELLLNELGITNVTILEGIFPEQTANLIMEDKCRFCHIDVDVYQSAKDIVDWIWAKMSVGGIIVYDDYGNQYCDGIIKCVEEQIHNPDRIIVYNLNGHAVVIKIR